MTIDNHLAMKGVYTHKHLKSVKEVIEQLPKDQVYLYNINQRTLYNSKNKPVFVNHVKDGSLPYHLQKHYNVIYLQ